MNVEIYSDIACPWCYIGERRFRRALAAFPGGDRVEVVYRSFQLDPNAPETPVPIRDYLRQRYGASTDGMLDRVLENARGEGIELNWDRVLSVNTFTAHRLLQLAVREYGPAVQRALAEKLFEAYFTRGEDVSDPELLASLAEEVGIDRERATAYLASDEGREETQAEIDRARALGITGVPTFVFEGRWAVSGAQPASAFLQVLEQIAAETGREGGGAGTGDTDSPADPDAACADGRCDV